MNLTYSELGYWVCATFQYLKSFSLDSENIDEFEVTMLAGQLAVLLNAVRGRGKLTHQAIERIAKAQKIGRTRLHDNLIPLLIKVKSDRVQVLMKEGRILGLEEHLHSAERLYEIVAQVWEMLDPTLIERGAIYVLQHTFLMPRTRTEELDLLTKDGLREQEAESSLGVTTSFGIVQSFEAPKLDESVLFNSYVWRTNQKKIAHAITHMPQAERDAVKQCVEEVRKWQALPVGALNTDRTLLTTAHAIGLVDIVEVNTAIGDQKEFVFTPHLTTHPNSTRFADDLLNDVRAVLACISYGETFSRISRLGGFKREKTINFLQKLLRNKIAGDATAIGVDYQLLEERGIISVEPTPTPPGGRYRMQLLRPEPISIALDVIEDATKSLSQPMLVHTKALDPASLFLGPEQTRINNVPALGSQPKEVKEARNYFLRTIRKEVF